MWTCSCGESHEDTFLACWKCGLANPKSGKHATETPASASIPPIDQPGTASKSTSQRKFRAPGLIASLTALAMMLCAAAVMTNVVLDWNDIDSAVATESKGWNSNVYHLALGVAAACFLRWTYVVKSNAFALGAQNLECTPGWSVGYYFIPLANLWMPYVALKEAFVASNPRSDDRRTSYSTLLQSWWALWLCSNLLPSFIDTFDLCNEESVFMITGLLNVPLCGVVIAMVRILSAMQTAQHRARVPVSVEAV